MKLSLQLKLGQQLTMTPQLQQAIRLLQLSTLDLQHEIQEALDSNPMLEVIEDTNVNDKDSNKNLKTDPTPSLENSDKLESDSPTNDSTSLSAATDNSYENAQELPNSDNWETSNIPEELPVDSNWEDIYTNSATPPRASSSESEEFNFDSINSATETLQDHLTWQLNLTPMSDDDRLIAMSIIDSVDTNGQLTSTLQSIHAGLIRELDIDEDEVLAVLHRIQQFDPVGVAYRDLKECLSLQARHLAPETPGLEVAHKVIADFLPQLASHDYSFIIKKLKLKEADLKLAINLILCLNPKPGSEITPSDTPYVIPDVFVSKQNNRWKVDLNPDTTPKIKVNDNYAALINRNDTGKENTFLKENLQEARWFIKSLQSRNETLMKVATKIVEHQQGFLEHGDEKMKPLVLHDIAEAVGMHESTISRVTTQKYLHTPRGIYELKYFFSSHVSTDTGGERSSTAIRAIIKKIIAVENPQKPLSDSKITDLLKDQGINIARRTIAKYRESLSIAPSNERKRLL